MIHLRVALTQKNLRQYKVQKQQNTKKTDTAQTTRVPPREARPVAMEMTYKIEDRQPDIRVQPLQTVPDAVR